MTSSERHLLPGQSRWDYSVQRYKSCRDVFCEPGLISIVFLACGRSDVTAKSLYSTIDSACMYKGEIEWIFVENGGSDENLALFERILGPRKVIIRQSNYGINEGLNQGWALSRGEFVMIHENDWECRHKKDFFSISRDIFNENHDVGIVQLRAINDPNENWGYNKPEYNPWSCTPEALQRAGISVEAQHTKAGHEFLKSKFPNGFHNNPIFIRKSLYRQCGPYPECILGSDPRHGESLYQSKVAKTEYATSHIGLELYYHIGKVTTKS